MGLGGRLRTLRQEAGVPRAEPARRAGAPRRTLRPRGHGRVLPGVPAFLRLAEALGVPAERLAEGVEDPAGERAESARDENPKHEGRARPATTWPLSSVLAPLVRAGHPRVELSKPGTTR